jgi:hypothetical protein
LKEESVKSYRHKGITFIASRGRTKILNDRLTVFVNYQSNWEELKAFLEKNDSVFSRKKSSIRSQSLNKPVKREEHSSKLSGYSVSIPEVKPQVDKKKPTKEVSPVKSEVNSNVNSFEERGVINYRTRGIAGEVYLIRELNSITPKECPVLFKYLIYPVSNKDLWADHKNRLIYIDVNSKKKQILRMCGK